MLETVTLLFRDTFSTVLHKGVRCSSGEVVEEMATGLYLEKIVEQLVGVGVEFFVFLQT